MNLAQLKWRCHRGTKELDYLLQGYLDTHYQQADESEQQLFIELLSCQDNQLQDWLFGDSISIPDKLSGLIEKIQQSSGF